eukprot:13041729-Ditylum_brightwellii.AAC.1
MDLISEEVLIDETTGGIQAFVIPTVYDASDVQVIMSEEELEEEAKKTYIKKVIRVACILAAIAVAIAVPSVIATGGRKIDVI